MESVAVLSHSFFNVEGKIIPCRTANVDLGLQDVDPGLVPNGAKCGHNKVHLASKTTIHVNLDPNQSYYSLSSPIPSFRCVSINDALPSHPSSKPDAPTNAASTANATIWVNAIARLASTRLIASISERVGVKMAGQHPIRTVRHVV